MRMGFGDRDMTEEQAEAVTNFFETVKAAKAVDIETASLCSRKWTAQEAYTAAVARGKEADEVMRQAMFAIKATI